MMVMMMPRIVERAGRVWAVLAIAAAVAASGVWAPASKAETVRTYTLDSEHYEITSNLPKRELREWAMHMDRTFEAFERAFSGFNTKNSKSVRLYLWADRASYIRHGFTIGADLRASGGVFFRRDGEAGVSTWVRGQRRQWLREVLQHEGFHQFAHLRFGDTLPIWVNEGLAVYFQHARLTGNRLVLGGAPRAKIEKLRSSLEDGRAFTFEEIVDLDNAKWWEVMRTQPQRASLMYSQSWSVAHFLIHADGGKYKGYFETYLRRIAQGWTHEAAFRDAFGTADKSGFAKRWREYVEEDLTPDPLTEAAERVAFLAAGLKSLHAEGVQPTSLDELKTELQERDFEVTTEHDGIERTVKATDEMFEAPEPERRGRRGRAREAEMRLIRGRRGLPPTVLVKGLKADVRLEWIEPRDEDEGELTFEIEYR